MWTPERDTLADALHDVRKNAERAATIAETNVQNFLDVSKALSFSIEHNVSFNNILHLYQCSDYEQLRLSVRQNLT